MTSKSAPTSNQAKNTSRLPAANESKIKQESTAEKILNAAEKRFAHYTYEGTTMREIALDVGIKEPSIYAHFANKEAVYGAVIDRALTPFSQEMGSWSTSPLTIKELFDIPRKLLALHARHPFSAQILHREFTNPRERISPKILQWLESMVGQSELFMSQLPDHTNQPLSKTKVVANMISLTNITLGFFATQGMHQALLEEDYDKDALFEEHVRMVSKIFKSLIV